MVQKDSFTRLIHIIDEYAKLSGLKLNVKKSIVLRVGSLKKILILPFLPEKENFRGHLIKHMLSV